MNFDNSEISKVEEDKPFEEYTMQDTIPKEDYKIKKDYENFLKGHNLLSFCILFVVIIFLVDFIWNNKQHIDPILEIFKIIIFTLMGFLFGKNSSD